MLSFLMRYVQKDISYTFSGLHNPMWSLQPTPMNTLTVDNLTGLDEILQLRRFGRSERRRVGQGKLLKPCLSVKF